MAETLLALGNADQAIAERVGEAIIEMCGKGRLPLRGEIGWTDFGEQPRATVEAVTETAHARAHETRTQHSAVIGIACSTGRFRMLTKARTRRYLLDLTVFVAVTDKLIVGIGIDHNLPDQDHGELQARIMSKLRSLGTPLADDEPRTILDAAEIAIHAWQMTLPERDSTAAVEYLM